MRDKRIREFAKVWVDKMTRAERHVADTACYGSYPGEQWEALGYPSMVYVHRDVVVDAILDDIESRATGGVLPYPSALQGRPTTIS